MLQSIWKKGNFINMLDFYKIKPALKSGKQVVGFELCATDPYVLVFGEAMLTLGWIIVTQIQGIYFKKIWIGHFNREWDRDRLRDS